MSFACLGYKCIAIHKYMYMYIGPYMSDSVCSDSVCSYLIVLRQEVKLSSVIHCSLLTIYDRASHTVKNDSGSCNI